ncbi:MAG TPA: hypothetical protein VJ112_03965 [Rhabdochlamydiaceae bacterium]|nr:hypothetical protein [Rhabdochlamydiaceae bacterium]
MVARVAASSVFPDFRNVNEAADSTVSWRRVTAYRLDEKGSPETEKVKDPSTGKEITRNKEYSFIEDARTKELYWDEPAFVVSMKCAGIALGTPSYTAMYMAWNLAKLPLDTVAIAGTALEKIGSQLKERKMVDAAATFWKEIVIQLPTQLFTDIWNIVKSPLFALGIEFAAIYGIFDPFRGRALEAKIEQIWQNNVSCKQDFRETQTVDTGSCWRNFVNDATAAKAFYFAWCFQVRGNSSDDKRFKIIRAENVKCC